MGEGVAGWPTWAHGTHVSRDPAPLLMVGGLRNSTSGGPVVSVLLITCAVGTEGRWFGGVSAARRAVRRRPVGRLSMSRTADMTRDGGDEWGCVLVFTRNCMCPTVDQKPLPLPFLSTRCGLEVRSHTQLAGTSISREQLRQNLCLNLQPLLTKPGVQ